MEELKTIEHRQLKALLTTHSHSNVQAPLNVFLSFYPLLHLADRHLLPLLVYICAHKHRRITRPTSRTSKTFRLGVEGLMDGLTYFLYAGTSIQSSVSPGSSLLAQLPSRLYRS